MAQIESHHTPHRVPRGTPQRQLIRRFNPAKSIPYGDLFSPGLSLVHTNGFEFETTPTRLSLRTVLCGQVTYLADGLKHVAHAGEIIVIGGGVKVLGGTARSSDTMCVSIYLNDDVPAFTCENTGDISVFVKLPTLSDEASNAFSDLIHVAQQEAALNWQAEYAFHHFGKSIAVEMAALSQSMNGLQASKLRTKNDLTTKLAHAKSILDQEYTLSFSLDRLAIQCGLSKFHLARSFQSAFGTSPRKYHESSRIAVACELIHQTKLTLGDISLRLGFESYASFSRTFKRVNGYSPSEVQRSAPAS